MRWFRTRGPNFAVLVLLGTGLAILPGASAQQNSPRIGYVYPAGGRLGTSSQVVVGGQHLAGVTNVYFSGSGVQAAVVSFARPMTQREANELREQLQQLQQRRDTALGRSGKSAGTGGAPPPTNTVSRATWTAEDQRQLTELRRKLAAFRRKPQTPAIEETVTLELRIAANASLGDQELRLATPYGLSNPLVFNVGQLPEVTKPEAKPETEPRFGTEPPTSVPPFEMNISLPATVNGQILPGGVDRFRFTAHQAQRLVILVSARKLIPYLADAVPGWFQASVALYDAAGHELDYADHYRFNPDPVLYYEIPKEGEYVLEIRDSIYRGREDFVYRIAVGELPFVTGLFPLGGRAGSQTTVELWGWNLPSARKTMDARDTLPGVYPLSVRAGEWLSNRMPFAVDTLPECLEKEPNADLDAAQPVTLPVIVNGRINPAGDTDVFRFEGEAGQVIVAEMLARRLNSPLDSVLRLTDAIGQQLAFNDDFEDKGSGLETHHADSYLRATLPADGTYYIHVTDAQHHGGPSFGYRLRLSAPRPDFDLRVVPSSLTARAGTSVPLTVFALRKDGFTNEIAIALKGAPDKFRLNGRAVPANEDLVKLSLSVPPTPLADPVTLNLEGRATIEGREVVHRAVPAEDMMQAFAYRHLVVAQELMVAVVERLRPPPPLRIVSETPVKIPVGGTGRVRVAIPNFNLANRVQFELADAPPGISIQSYTPIKDGMEIVFQSDAAKLKPGLKGALTVKAYPPRPAVPPPPNATRPVLATLPQIPFEIVAP